MTNEAEYIETIPAARPDVPEGYRVGRWPNGSIQVKHFSRNLNSTFGSNFPSLEEARSVVATWNAEWLEREKIIAEIKARRIAEEAARPKLTVKEAIQRWEGMGRIAIHHPRKGTISLDGGRAMGEDAAVRRIQECLDRLAV